MNIAERQKKAKQNFKIMIAELISAGWTPLSIAREISGGDESFTKSYRPAIAQKLANGTTLPNWVIGEEIRKLHKKQFTSK